MKKQGGTGRNPSNLRRVRESAKASAAAITAQHQADRARRAASALPFVEPPKGPPRPIEHFPRLAPTDELMDRLEGRYARLIIASAEAAERAEFQQEFANREYTPETERHLASEPTRIRMNWPLGRMAKLGKISADELVAAQEICSIAEGIERAVSVRSGSLEARVDCEGSGKDTLVESLGRIRAEVAYTAWRESIPMPRRMILDMILTNVPYNRIAAAHGLHWRTARKRLITALRHWPSCKIEARHAVGKDEVLEVYAKLGEGVLLPPKPRNQPTTEIVE